ncbi:hypothetical protein CPL00364_CDS0005 [Klebsiella phage PoeticCupcake]
MSWCSETIPTNPSEPLVVHQQQFNPHKRV